MNMLINDFLSVDSKYKIPNILMPHQLATIDFLFKAVIRDNKSILLYHKMGSGKTILCLTFAILNSVNRKIIIIVPNNTIVNIWQRQIEQTINILPNIEYNLNNIQIKTRSKFIDEINGINSTLINKIQIYDNHLIFIDEVHNFFGNSSGSNLIKIKNNIDANFILLTGSPISNTVEPLRELLIILRDNNSFDNKFINKGKRVYETSLSEEAKIFIEKELKNYITYYDQEDSNLPNYYYEGQRLISYPVILCEMSELQEKSYTSVLNSMDNKDTDLFSKIPLNVSFCALGKDIKYYNYNKLIGQNIELLPGLNISGNYLYGQELKDLNISSKFKYFRDEYITKMTRSKKFMYFSNSKIGSFVIRSIMRENGISEYDKEIVSNYVCTICNSKRNCPEILKTNCMPAKFSIITSNELNTNTNIINIILDKYNDPENDKGDSLMYLFGSKIISESYTLKEVTDIVFLTVPDTKSELTQIIARALRSFSYKDIKNTKVVIKILLAIKKKNILNKIVKVDNKIKEWGFREIDNTKIENIDKYIEFLENENLEYDIKKLFYLEVKSNQSDTLLDILKKLHCDYNDKPVEEIREILFYEKIKRIFYKQYYLENLSNFFKFENKQIIDQVNIDSYINKIKKNGINIYHKTFKNSILTYFSNTKNSAFYDSKNPENKNKKIFHIIPLRLTVPDYLMKINLKTILNFKKPKSITNTI